MSDDSDAVKAKVIWAGTVMGQEARVIVEGKAARSQVRVIKGLNVWGASPDTVMSLAIMTTALVAVSAQQRIARTIYELLESKALSLDKASPSDAIRETLPMEETVSISPSDAIRDIMDVVWYEHLSSGDRASLSRRTGQ